MFVKKENNKQKSPTAITFVTKYIGHHKLSPNHLVTKIHHVYIPAGSQNSPGEHWTETVYSHCLECLRMKGGNHHILLEFKTRKQFTFPYKDSAFLKGSVKK